MNHQTKQSSFLPILLLGAVGLISGLLIAEFRFKLPKIPNSGG